MLVLMSAEPLSFQRMAKATRKSRAQEMFELATRRAEILGSDEVYCSNMANLTRNITNGTVPKEMYSRVQPSLAEGALRRAGVSLSMARAMMKA